MARQGMKRASSQALLERQAQSLHQELEQKFPDLTVCATDTKVYVRGAFPVWHEGSVLDRYQVEIDWNNRDTEVPVLRETGGRIPWIADRHMSKGGMACLFVPEEWLLRPRDERTITHYLDGPVRNYFLWQSLFERGESPPWGERSHGIPGLIEAYGDMVGMQGESAVKRCLEYLSRDRIKGHWMCPCGRNLRARDCHIEHLRQLKRKIPRYIAVLALKRLKNPIIR